MSLLACKICKTKTEQTDMKYVKDEWEEGGFYKKREFYACNKCAKELEKQKVEKY